ncbi:MAG: hypothetical protein AABX29_01495 [Nanoarchaeota archaeon]
MPTLTLAIPEELKNEMDSIPELNWSEVARQAFLQKVKEYKLFKELISKSKLTKKNAKELANKINLAVSKRFTEGA